MKPIVALMITGLLASTAALAQDSKMAAPAPAASAPRRCPDRRPTRQEVGHHKKKKSHKAAMAKTEGDMKKSEMKPSAPMAPMAPATPDTKK